MSRQLFFPVPILVVILLTLYAGCRKDDLYNTGTTPGSDFSIQNLKALVSSRSGDALSIRTGGGDSTDITLTDDYAVQPDWNIRIVYRDTQGDTIRTLVPCRTGAPFQLLGPQGTTFLQFQRGVNALNNTPVITCKVVTMIPEELYINFERFSGVAIVHDISSLMATAYKVSHDTIRGQGQINFGSLVNWQSSLDIRDNPGKALPCYSFRDPWYERVWDFLNWFINPGNSPYGFSFGEISSGGSWNNLNDTRPPGGSGSGGSGTGTGGTNPGNNNSGVIVDLNAWANVDFELAMKFGNDNGAYDYMVALKQQAQYDNAKKLRYYRILNFYKHLLTIPPDINQNLAYAPGPCPHGGCQPIDLFDYFIRTQSPFANQVILHFTGNTNLTSMALYSWAWKINDGLSMEKIDEYIAAHPELHGPFQSVGYTLPQITNNSLYNNIIAKFDKLRFLDELCALDNQAISELLLADNHGDVIGDAYDFYFAQGQTKVARDFIKSYLSTFNRQLSDQFSQYIAYWNNVPSFLISIGFTPATTDFIEAGDWLRSHIEVLPALGSYSNAHPDAEGKAALKLHIETMMEYPAYYEQIVDHNFPELGSNSWVDCLDLWIWENNPLYELWHKLTPAEKYLCYQSPRKAIIMAVNTKKAGEKSRSIWGSGMVERNSKCDAFRHAYWIALNAQDMNESSVIDFYTARESETQAHLILEKQMDMHNNYWGLQAGKNNPTASEGMLAAIILSQYMETGVLRYLSPLDLNDPCFWKCNEYDKGTGGIGPSTQLIPTHE